MSFIASPGTQAGCPADSGRKPEPYLTAHEHVADLLERHDVLLRRELVRSGGRQPADLPGIEHALQEVEQRITLRVAQSIARGVRLPLLELAHRFALSAQEMDILFACFAVELDRRYERLYGHLHDDMGRRLPSPGLVLSLFCSSTTEQFRTRALLNPLAPLRYYRLLEVLADATGTPWLACPMRIDERIVAFLLGDDAIDSRLARHVTRLNAAPDDAGFCQHQLDSLDAVYRHALHWTTTTLVRRKPLIYLHGARGAGADAMVGVTAQRLGVPLLVLDAEMLGGAGGDLESIIHLLLREGLLSQAAIYLRHVDRLFEPASGTGRYAMLMRCISEMGSIMFASGERSWCWPIPPEPIALLASGLRAAGSADQFELWQSLSRHQLAPADLHRLVSLHPLPLGAVRDAWRMAQGLAEAQGRGGVPCVEDLYRACQAQCSMPANALARQVVPAHDWSDLVLPAAQLEQLVALCSQAKHASIVYGAWGFERKLSLGRALNALFCGPPGTGKTLAAEVVAADLGLPLLKIDLSQVVSKYIGDTEKNLGQLFDQAASANAILFFDEADALLGKRSDVTDAHDRHANTETAYLLQKMEEYTGITILATNLRQNMDDAFTRRMRFIVEFPFPDDADRLRIWQTAWPCEVPLAPDIDLPLLARQYRFSGGNIRNVALSAAFLAAEQGQQVSMRHLVRATRREMQKMGRLVHDEEVRRHG